MENNKNKKSVKFQGDMLNFCDFIQVFVFTRNHHLKSSIFCLRLTYRLNTIVDLRYVKKVYKNSVYRYKKFFA